MSRVCVKNIGKNVSEKQLKEVFGAKGEVTDVKVMRTNDGRSRQFAFVGFRTEQQAEEAKKYFDQTFIGLSRIAVELARKMEGDGRSNKKEKPNSRDRLKELRDKLINDGQAKPLASDKKKVVKGATPVEVVSRKKADFMAAARPEKPAWEEAATQHSKDRSEDASHQESEGEADGDEQSEIGDDESSTASAPVNDDLAYLKSKVGKPKVGDEADSDTDVFSDDEEASAEEEKGAADVAVSDATEQPEEPKPAKEEEFDEARLFLRNLPYSASEEEVRELCAAFGSVEEVHISLGREKKPKGFGFVSFLFPEDADKAMEALNGNFFQGRVLRVSKALHNEKDESVDLADLGKMSAFKLKKEEERRKLATRKEGWNAAFVRSDAVVDALANKYGVEDAEILDTSLRGGDLAVRMAIGETQVIQENQSYLTSHGVDLNALESASSTSRAVQRSATTLLIKNLPPETAVEELEAMFARYGGLQAFVVPPSRTLAVVDYTEPTEARAALKGLAYRRYKNSPLYIEFAPTGVLKRIDPVPSSSKDKSAAPAPAPPAPTTSAHSTSTASSSGAQMAVAAVGRTPVAATESTASAGDDEGGDYSTVFIKNLNFSTNEEALHAHIQGLGVPGLRAVIIQKKHKGAALLSMGYGFAEFSSAAHAAVAVQRINKSVLEEHLLECKPSEKKLSERPAAVSAAQASNKLLVKNVAFQASKQEVKALFEAFGAVKVLRMPRQVKSTQHRGFAFVEFHTKQEAARAMSALRNTHLYGRHLVIDWAKEEDVAASLQGGDEAAQERERMQVESGLEGLRKRARRDEQVVVSGRKRAKGGAEEVDPNMQDVM